MNKLWKYHDKKMKELKSIYSRISRQTQNRLQEIFDSMDFNFDNLYNIASKKAKDRIDVYIEEWKDKGLLTGYFGTLANSIYRRARVKNNEILELLIYGAYIEEQNQIQSKEEVIFKEIINHYYQKGQKEVNKTLSRRKRKLISIIPDSIMLHIITMPNSTGFLWKEYVELMAKSNADQIYRQVIVDLQQQKEPNINADIYQNIIRKQQNSKLCINDDKISGVVDTSLIGMNNQAKIEGYKSVAGTDEVEVIFVAVGDERTTDMCMSLNGQTFKVNGENSFIRYSAFNKSNIRYKCIGLVKGLNLPPITDHIHYCRSTVVYKRH